MIDELYAICRMLDGSFTLHKLKPHDGMNTMTVSSDEIKRLHRKDALCGSGGYALLETSAFQEFFRNDGELTGEDRRLLVPCVTYSSRDLKTLYVVPITVDDVKLPRLSRGMYEPGGGYINPTFLSQKPKKEDAT